MSDIDEEIDFLDMLVVVAEHWKMLVFGPLLLGCIAFAAVTNLKLNFYQSTSILRLSEDEINLVYSPLILDSLAESFGYLSRAQGFRENAREAVKSDLLVSVSKQSKFVTFATKSLTPENAQKLNEEAVKLILQELIPKGREKIRIISQIQIRKKSNELLERILEQEALNLSKNILKAETASQVDVSSLSKTFIDNSNVIEELESKLSVKGGEVFVQYPTLPHQPLPRKRGLIAIVVTLVSGLTLLLLVFVRKALFDTRVNPESLVKIKRIKQAFSFSIKKR